MLHHHNNYSRTDFAILYPIGSKNDRIQNDFSDEWKFLSMNLVDEL